MEKRTKTFFTRCVYTLTAFVLAGSMLFFVPTKSAEAIADPYRWEGIAPEDAGSWRGIASSSDGSKLIAARGNTVYLSSDKGTTWSKTGLSSGTWLGVASSANGTKLVAIEASRSEAKGVYTSDDAGKTWRKTSLSVFALYSVSSSDDGQHLVVTQNEGNIFSSSDGGVSWTTSDAPVLGWRDIASSSDGTKVAAVSSQGIYTSVDSGITWSKTSAKKISWRNITMSADGTNITATAGLAGIYTSTDSGLTWTMSNLSLTASWDDITSSSNGMYLFVVANDFSVSGSTGIYTSLDSGITWSKSSAGAGAWQNIASSSDGIQLAATRNGSSGGIYTSPDGGKTWTAKFNPEATTVTSVDWYSGALSQDNSLITLASSSQFVKSNDNGSTWITSQSTLASPIYSVTPTENPANLIASGDVVYTSNDGGLTWGKTNTPNGNWYSTAASGNGQRIFGAYLSGSSIFKIYASYDNGVTWAPTSAPSSKVWDAVASSNDGYKLVAVQGQKGGIYTSKDSGVTWQKTSAPDLGWYWCASSRDGNMLVATVSGAGGTIYRSIDGGATWSKTAAPTKTWQFISSSADGSRLAATANDGLYTSIDGGASWNKAITSTNLNTMKYVSMTADGSKILSVKNNVVMLGTLKAPPTAPGVDTPHVADKSVTGFAVAGDTVLVTFANGQKVESVVDADGKWSAEVPTGLTLKAGDTFTTQVTSADSGFSSEIASHTVVDYPPDPPVVSDVTVGDHAISGTASPGDIVTVSFASGRRFTASVRLDGTWTVALPDDVTLVAGDEISLETTSASTGLTSSVVLVAVLAAPEIPGDPESPPTSGSESGSSSNQDSTGSSHLSDTGIDIFAILSSATLISVVGIAILHRR